MDSFIFHTHDILFLPTPTNVLHCVLLYTHTHTHTFIHVSNNSCAWDERTIRRLVGDGKLAARQTGKECRETGIEQECPICFLYYDEINTLKCCNATICTECYLQLQNPTAAAEGNHHNNNCSNHTTSSSPCPFCAKPDMAVEKAKHLDVEDVLKREEEEQRVIEATIRARANSETKSLRSEKSDGDSSSGGGVEKDFGSRLNEELRRSRRKSSIRTISSDSDAGTGAGENNDSMSIDTIAMTVEERRELENRMKSQLSHPLMREMQRNAEIESQRHLLEHAERRRDQVRNSRDSLERFIERARIREHGLNLISGSSGRGMGRSEDEEDRDGRPDNLYLLEAALFLSAREDSLRRRREGHGQSGVGGRNRNRETALLQALMAGPRGDRGSIDELLNARYERRRNDIDDTDNNRDGRRNEHEDRGSNNNRFGLTPTDILLAGVSEASQIEMAIQMSLREAEQQQQEQNQQDVDENGNEQNTEEVVETTEN